MRFFARRLLPPRRVASLTDEVASRGAPPTRRSWPILSPVFVPTAEPVGDPAPAEPAPYPDLSFFFAGQDLRRSPHSRAKFNFEPSVTRAIATPRARSSDCCSIRGIERDRSPPWKKRLSETVILENTSWLWGPRFWCWWSRWWSSRPLDCSVRLFGAKRARWCKDSGDRAGDFNARAIRTHVFPRVGRDCDCCFASW